MNAMTDPQSGFCRFHGPMLEVNGNPTCIQCSTPRRPSGLMVPIGSVSQAEIDELNSAAKVEVGERKSISLPPVIIAASGAPVKQAIALLNTVPAPKNISLYKKLVKAIALLEEIELGSN